MPRVSTDGIECIWGIPIPTWGSPTGTPGPSDEDDYPVEPEADSANETHVVDLVPDHYYR